MNKANVEKGFVKQAMAKGVSEAEAISMLKQGSPLARLASLFRGGAGAARDLSNEGTQALLTSPRKALTSLTGLGVAGLAPFWVGESAYRSAASFSENKGTPEYNPGFRVPTSVNSIAAAPANALVNMPMPGLAGGSVGGLFQAGAQNLIAGALSDPGVQQFLDKTVKATEAFKGIVENPNFLEAAKATQGTIRTVDKLSNPDNIIAGADALRKYLGEAASHGLKAVSDSFIKHPGAVAGSVGLTMLPMIMYDLATRKRREERALLDKALLTHLNSHKKKVKTSSDKTAGLKEILTSFAGHAPKLNLTPEQQAIADTIKRVVRHNPQVPADKIQDFINKSGPSVDINALNAFANKQVGILNPERWSIMNNPLTRNPGKTTLGGLAGISAIGGIAEGQKFNENHGDVPYVVSSSKQLAGSLMAAPRTVLDFEMKALDDGRWGQVEQAIPAKIKSDLAKIIENGRTIPETITKQWNQSKVELAKQDKVEAIKDKVEKLNPAPTASLFESLKPGLMVGAVLGAPYLGYHLYDKYFNKKLNKVHSKNKELKDEVL